MAKIFKAGRVVILLAGRYAGRKAVVINGHENGTRDKPFSHALVVGMDKYPGKVTKKMSETQVKKQEKIKTFIKTINYTHLMPTRYIVTDFEMKKLMDETALKADNKKELSKTASAVLSEKFLDPDQSKVSKDILFLRRKMCF